MLQIISVAMPAGPRAAFLGLALYDDPATSLPSYRPSKKEGPAERAAPAGPRTVSLGGYAGWGTVLRGIAILKICDTAILRDVTAVCRTTIRRSDAERLV